MGDGHSRDELVRGAGWLIADRVLTVMWTDGNPDVLGL